MLALLVGGGLAVPPPAAAQISPGPLARAHHDMDGPAGCTQCHAISGGSPNFMCRDCHREIATRIAQKRGLHPAVIGGSTGSETCSRCHSEHNGENFALVRFDTRTFRHSVAGWELNGKHATLECRQCHNAEKVVPSERGSIAIHDLNRTFLGLSRTCTSCHEDKHRGQLGQNCLQCHTENSWKDRRFDHARTRFPLTGAHAQVTCEKCHAPQADGMLRFAGVKFDQCTSCHNDPHRGAFAEQMCNSCHTTATWQKSAFAEHFDHSKTKFALLGKHVGLRCETCHKGGDFKSPIAHDTCASCHTPDPHGGQFAKRADGGKCESCHTVDAFKPATFALAQHQQTGFPLQGKHAALACAQCHVPADRATLFKVKFAQCTDCHKDSHDRQFAAAPYRNQCQLCHNENTYRPATFSLARHQQSSFVLTGGHVALACNECHKPDPRTKTVLYHFNGTTCTACHSDPHRGQFAARMMAVDSRGNVLGCEACHSTKAWHDLSRFDHGSTRFALIGAHRATECGACHRPKNLERNLLNVDFKSAPMQCEECHDDPHGAQFASVSAVTRCASCHNSMKWRPSMFDHEKTIFSLKGAHQNVRCEACHTNIRTVAGKAVLFYKPAPTACAACHGNGNAVGAGL